MAGQLPRRRSSLAPPRSGPELWWLRHGHTLSTAQLAYNWAREFRDPESLVLRILIVTLLILVGAGPASSQQDTSHRIASFNIRDFGPTKAAQPAILNYLAEVVRHFDIVAVQEISDVRETVPRIFLEAINAIGAHYQVLLSERTGKQPDDRTSQEQYAFYFNADRVVALDLGALFDDSRNDRFQREPFTALFGLIGSNLTLTITQVHTRPESALHEVDALFEVYEDVGRRYPSERNHLIVGDFNASCSYASPQQLRSLQIRGPSFRWIVPDTADTTVSPTTRCAYDRIVANSALRTRFARWGVADWFTDPAISDHWPVWVSFRANMK